MPGAVLVTGASSQLGIFLLPRLVAAGLDVTALSRRAPAAGIRLSESLIWIPPDGTGCTPAAADFLISCGPLGLACERVEGMPSLRRVVAFSSSSVLSKQSSGNASEQEQMTEMKDQEDGLRRLCRERSVPLLLLRPTMIYGCGLDNNVSFLAATARRLGFIPVAGRATGLRQPVHADDLAALAVAAIVSGNPVNLAGEICGGSTLTYRDMASRIAGAVSEKCRVISVPLWLMMPTITILSRFRPWRSLNAEMVRRQSMDLVFDDSAVREALNCDPRPFEPTPEDFEVPGCARALQLQPS